MAALKTRKVSSVEVKVIKSFRDKHTKAFHRIGDILKVSKERFNEINSNACYIEKLQPIQAPKTNKKKKRSE